MGKIMVKDREIVSPGEILGEGMDVVAGKNTYRINDKIISKVAGIVSVQNKVVSIIPLKGVYIPEKGDTVIGEIIELGFANWIVDIGAPWYANLPLGEAVSEFVDVLRADISKYFDIGDFIFAKIINIPRSKMIQLSLKGPGLKKLKGGRIVKVLPSKVPRIIGKKGSMISMIKRMTKCEILVGQNGWIWVKGDPEKELLVFEALRMIERESHIKGLTEKVKKFLEGELK